MAIYYRRHDLWDSRNRCFELDSAVWLSNLGSAGCESVFAGWPGESDFYCRFLGFLGSYSVIDRFVFGRDIELHGDQATLGDIRISKRQVVNREKRVKIGKYGVLLAVVLVATFFVRPTFANELDDRTKELNDLNKRIQEQQSQLKELGKRRATLQNQIEILDNQIGLSELQLQAIGAEIAQTEAQMKNINGDLVAAEIDIFEKKRSLQSAVTKAYTSQKVGLIEVVIGSGDLSDFISELEYISTIQTQITKGIGVLRDLNESLSDKKGQLEVADKQLKSLRSAEELQRNSLVSQQTGKETLLADTQNSESEYQRKLDQSIQEQASLQAEIARLAKNAPKVDLKPGILQWPIASRLVTAGFREASYFARFRLQHNAVDIATPQGTPVRAPANAYVLRAKDAGMGYSYIQLNHGEGLVTVYGHISSILVTEGQFVPQGTTIGLSGATPGTPGAGLLTTGPHLHFEVWKDGQARNPLSFLGS